jgi:hypothetical protein
LPTKGEKVLYNFSYLSEGLVSKGIEVGACLSTKLFHLIRKCFQALPKSVLGEAV